MSTNISTENYQNTLKHRSLKTVYKNIKTSVKIGKRMSINVSEQKKQNTLKSAELRAT